MPDFQLPDLSTLNIVKRLQDLEDYQKSITIPNFKTNIPNAIQAAMDQITKYADQKKAEVEKELTDYAATAKVRIDAAVTKAEQAATTANTAASQATNAYNLAAAGWNTLKEKLTIAWQSLVDGMRQFYTALENTKRWIGNCTQSMSYGFTRYGQTLALGFAFVGFSGIQDAFEYLRGNAGPQRLQTGDANNWPVYTPTSYISENTGYPPAGGGFLAIRDAANSIFTAFRDFLVPLNQMPTYPPI